MNHYLLSSVVLMLLAVHAFSMQATDEFSIYSATEQQPTQGEYPNTENRLSIFTGDRAISPELLVSQRMLLRVISLDGYNRSETKSFSKEEFVER